MSKELLLRRAGSSRPYKEVTVRMDKKSEVYKPLLDAYCGCELLARFHTDCGLSVTLSMISGLLFRLWRRWEMLMRSYRFSELS